MKRKEFLQSLLGSSALLSIPKGSSNFSSVELSEAITAQSKYTNGSMYGYSGEPIPKVKVGIIGLGNRGQTLIQMFTWLVQKGHAEIRAICDIQDVKIQKAKESIATFQSNKPQIYTGNLESWKKLAAQDDLDLILIAAPWRYHAPMSIYGMQQGKHVASEVPIAYSLEECWQIVEVAENTRRHCIMIENCCYNGEELFVLNMIEQGVFGDVTHAEGAYLHDLRALLLDDDYYQGQWRIQHHVTRDGNFYTTHGLGPIAFYLGIGRGDAFTHLTSMSSREHNLSHAARQVDFPQQSFKCGDMNNTLMKTHKGKTVLLQFDVHTGRPYSRINKVVGTKAVHDGYPSRLYIEGDKPEFWGHKWLDQDNYTSYRKQYEHPIYKKLKKLSQEFKQGHGGMDFVMIYRLIRCLNLGLPLDINVYDGVLWSAVTPLSEISVASQSMSVPVPDFTGGKWKEKEGLEIMREIG